MATVRRPSPAGSTVAVTALALTLAGCSATNPVTTYLDFSPSDGVDIGLGEVSAESVLILTAGEGEPGTMIAGLTNRGVEEAEVSIIVAGSDEPLLVVTVGPEETVLVGPDQEESVLIESVPEPPGALAEVTLTSDRGGAATARVPVLDGTLEPYDQYVPVVPVGDAD